MEYIDVSIIIVNYNLTESIKNLLQSVIKYVKDIKYEVIVVDNNSKDRGIENLAYEFPDFQFIYLKTNFGFGYGNNIGFSKSKGKYLLLLNPDTYLIDNIPLNLYRFSIKHPDFGIIGPQLIFPNGKFQISSSKFPNFFHEIGNVGGLNYKFSYLINFVKNNLLKKDYYSVDYVFGSCMMIKTQLYRELNGFDEDYFLFAEEADLCYRTLQNTNYKVVYYLGGKVVHIKSLITGKNLPERVQLGYESKFIFFKKHYSSLRNFILGITIISIVVPKYLLSFRKKNKNDYRKVYSIVIDKCIKELIKNEIMYS